MNFLFIGGAPRSGTTLLSNLLDAHPEILMFPTEHSTLENFFWHQNNIEEYARSTFIDKREGGQQTFLTNRNLYERNWKHLKKEFGKSFPVMPIDPDAFKAAYLESLNNKTASLENILFALAEGLTASDEFAGQFKLEQRKFAAFKQPFFTELFAQQAANSMSGCRFIHVLRDPVARYASAKTRRLKDRRRLGPINRLSYVNGHTTIDLASRHLAEENISNLGDSVYRTVKFEDMITSPKETICSLLDWLHVQSDNFQIVPTRNGKPVKSGSTLSQGHAVDSTSNQRSDVYLSITSPAERLIHTFLLAASKGEKCENLIHLILAFLQPLPKSSWKNYVCQLIELARCLARRNPFPVKYFLDKARRNNCEISGAT